jgi:hypothetical protein
MYVAQRVRGLADGVAGYHLAAAQRLSNHPCVPLNRAAASCTASTMF